MPVLKTQPSHTCNTPVENSFDLWPLVNVVIDPTSSV